MTEEIIPFDFDGHRVRTGVDEIGDPWFVADDVCKALGYTNTPKAVADHVDSDDITVRYIVDARGRKQRTNTITESGVYALVFGSRLPSAKKFKRWVTKIVLPELRKHGVYGAVRIQDMPPILQAVYRPHEVMFKREIAEGLALLNGEKFNGRHPFWAKKHYSIIWECIAGKEVARKLTRINSNSHYGRNHHQLLREEFVKPFRDQLGVVAALLSVSVSLRDFIEKLRFFYQQKPFQLPLSAQARPKR